MRWYFCVFLSAVCGLIGVPSWAEPELEWAYETKGKIYASPIVVDLDGDGQQEVVACASRAGRVMCLDGAGNIRWDYRMVDQGLDGIQATPSAVDYDGDGKREVFFVTSGGTLGCLDHQGSLIWRAVTGDKTDYSGPVLADIDSDGHIEIVFGSDSGTVYCYDDAGLEKWHHQGDGQVRGIPAVALHPPSGTMRVYVTFGGGDSACLSSEGDVVWSQHEPAARNERRSGPAVGDLDGDGALEVVLATEDGHVVVRNAFSGEERWRFKLQHKIDQTHSFALADFDGSGRLDVVCGDGTGLGGPGHVYRLRDGKALWTADVGGGVVQGPSVGDVDGDGKLEALVCSRSKRLICLSDDGQEQWSFSTDAGSLTTPALGDVDADGEVEIVFGSKDRHLYCLTVGGACDPTRLPCQGLPWPMMNRDPQLSGNALGAPYAPSPLPQGAIDDVLRVDRFGPLSAGMNTILFSFGNDTYRPRHLEAVATVTRPDGSRVTDTVTGRVEAYETKSASFDLPADEDGRYRLALRLVDVGTGKTLAAEEAGFELDAFAQMAAQFDGFSQEAKKGIKALSKGPARTRAEAKAVELKSLREMIDRGRSLAADDKERATTISEVQASLKQWERFVARLRAASRTPGAEAEFAVVADTTLRKVFGDEPYATEELAAVLGDAPRAAVSVARNEYEGVQLVVVPLWQDLSGLR
ncbi:MAG: PQQ-like beta-propeller repeat protein, partial [bacterium]|nr:PQQ-like beta-propeller repeat protein [bacterium]